MQNDSRCNECGKRIDIQIIGSYNSSQLIDYAIPGKVTYERSDNAQEEQITNNYGLQQMFGMKRHSHYGEERQNGKDAIKEYFTSNECHRVMMLH